MAGYVFALFVAFLLASTTPVGTGAGVHQFDLVHPLFSHMHIVNGRALTHEQMQAQGSASPAMLSGGPAFGAGSGATGVDTGVGVSPTLPIVSTLVALTPDPVTIHADVGLPTGRVEAPPDPPPTLLA